MNRAIVIGNLGQDPEVRYTQGGTAVCNFSVATSRRWTDKQSGQKKEETDWHNIEVWGKMAEVCGEYLQKGRKVCVEGRMKTDAWEKDGVKKYRAKIVAENVEFLSPKGGGRNSGSDEGGEPGALPPGTGPDDIPF